jgi:hypothetical protein
MQDANQIQACQLSPTQTAAMYPNAVRQAAALPVTAVMITGKHPDRYWLAERAVRSFQEQVGGDCRLLVVNDGDRRLFPEQPPDNIREIFLTDKDKSWTLGDLRNLALDHLPPNHWCIQWDDDDWYHPERIWRQWQEAQLFSGKERSLWTPADPPVAVTLRYQVRASLTNYCAFLVDYKDRGEKSATRWGIPGSILHSPVPATWRYESVGKHEDSRFLKQFGVDRVRVLDNEDLPELYIRLHHVHSTWSGEHVMKQFAHRRSVWGLPPRTASYVRQVLTREYDIAASQLPGGKPCAV